MVTSIAYGTSDWVEEARLGNGYARIVGYSRTELDPPKIISQMTQELRSSQGCQYANSSNAKVILGSIQEDFGDQRTAQNLKALIDAGRVEKMFIRRFIKGMSADVCAISLVRVYLKSGNLVTLTYDLTP